MPEILEHRKAIAGEVESILGVLKAGAAYVPIDPVTPDERCRFILRDTDAQVVITQRRYADRFTLGAGRAGAGEEPGTRRQVRVVVIDDDEAQALLAWESESNPDPPLAADSLAYVIYTSGTTGRPKGVLQTHGNVVRLFDQIVRSYLAVLAEMAGHGDSGAMVRTVAVP